MDRLELGASGLAVSPIAFGTYRIAPVLPEFLRRYPGIHVELTLTERLTDLLDEGVDVPSTRTAFFLAPNRFEVQTSARS